MRILHIQSSSGIAGDMFVAACLDAGVVAPADVLAVPKQLGLDGVSVRIERIKRASIMATHVSVEAGALALSAPAPEAQAHHHTHYAHLDGRLRSSTLPEGARETARAIFRHLATAEAAAHGGELDGVVFHEVGSVDSIVDVAMAGVCIDTIHADRVTASPVPLGRGFVDIAHGVLPVPPPATVHLAQGVPIAPVPPHIEGANVELSTPTGLSILKTLSPQFQDTWPEGVPLATGLGAGSRDLGRVANVLRIVVMDSTEQAADNRFAQDEVLELTCNIDDQTPERSAWAQEEALRRGALDAWIVPVIGKKGRPAIQFSLLTEPPRLESLVAWMLEATSTFGVRFRLWERRKLIKNIARRRAPDGTIVRYAIGTDTNGQVFKEKAEYEDVRRQWERREQ
jgi:uncharacterized protein (TIGR00299 family) protein